MAKLALWDAPLSCRDPRSQKSDGTGLTPVIGLLLSLSKVGVNRAAVYVAVLKRLDRWLALDVMLGVT